MNPFSLLLQLSCLSQREAASYLKTSSSTIDKWSRGVREVPDAVLEEMRTLIDMQCDAADEALDILEHQCPDEVDEIELGYPFDDHEAQTLGWPCVGAWKGMASRVIAECQQEVLLVPRGSTLSTAIAADIHDELRGRDVRLKH